MFFFGNKWDFTRYTARFVVFVATIFTSPNLLLIFLGLSLKFDCNLWISLLVKGYSRLIRRVYGSGRLCCVCVGPVSANPDKCRYESATWYSRQLNLAVHHACLRLHICFCCPRSDYCEILRYVLSGGKTGVCFFYRSCFSHICHCSVSVWFWRYPIIRQSVDKKFADFIFLECEALLTCKQ